MYTVKFNLLTKTLFLSAATLFASSLSIAVPMSGSVSFSGGDAIWDRGDISGDSTGYIDFSDQISNATVTETSGDFENLFSIGQNATFYDFSYKPNFTPTQIWTATSQNSPAEEISFTMLNIDTAKEIITPVFGSITMDNLIVAGLGIIESDSGGSVLVNATFKFTGQGVNLSPTSFTWSSTTTVVPDESSTLSLIALGLVGLATVARRKNI